MTHAHPGQQSGRHSGRHSHSRSGLCRGLSIWQAVGIPVALMAVYVFAGATLAPQAGATPSLARKLSMSLEEADRRA